MHIHQPDIHNACCQPFSCKAFHLEQNFPSLSVSCSSAFILLFFMR